MFWLAEAMETAIRPPTRSEMPSYYQALPMGNGLPSWEPAPAAWHGGSEPWPQPRPPATPEQMTRWADSAEESDTFHPMAAFVGGKLAGASATISFEVTVPGYRQVPMAGVTATGVLATHRRQGLLRGMMHSMFDGALERGEPISMLSASEGSIYGRYGFSPATYRTRWEIERSEAELQPTEPSSGSLDLVDAVEARAAWPALHEVARLTTVGELSALPGWWNGLSDAASGTNGPMRYLLHRDAAGDVDGIANFRLPWSSTLDDAGTLVVEAIQASSHESYRAIWRLLLDFDLTRKVVAPARPRDEPLRWMLKNPRAMRTTRQSDNLWLRLLDVPSALESRAYATTESLTFSIESDDMCPANVGTWHLNTDTTGSSCVRAKGRPDLTLDVRALGSLYLGGMSAHLLTSADLIVPHHRDAVSKLSRMFRVDPEPHNSFGF